MSDKDSSVSGRSRDEAPAGPGRVDHMYQFKVDATIAGQYRVVAPIGFGGFAEVYHCQDRRLGTPVALKIILPEQVTQKLSEEAKKAARLRGGLHIVQVYDVAGTDEKPFYISMQLLTGGTLEQRLDEVPGRHLPLKDPTLEILEQVGEALDHAHQRLIVHLDVKPSNIL